MERPAFFFPPPPASSLAHSGKSLPNPVMPLGPTLLPISLEAGSANYPDMNPAFNNALYMGPTYTRPLNFVGVSGTSRIDPPGGNEQNPLALSGVNTGLLKVPEHTVLKQTKLRPTMTPS